MEEKTVKKEDEILKFVTDAQISAEDHRTLLSETWSDEKKIYSGDHWDVSFARRSKKSKQKHPNSQDNFVFPSVLYKYNTLTASTPKVNIGSTESTRDGESIELKDELQEIQTDDKRAKKITAIVDSVLYKNIYKRTYKKIVLQGLQHGPFIASVLWDEDWTGGTGPNRWLGEIRVSYIDVRDFYPDPGIVDLTANLQDCEFINIKYRKKLSYFKKRFNVEVNESERGDEYDDREEGERSKMANLYLCWHRGMPKKIPEKWKKIFTKRMEETDDHFKKEKYKAMLEGTAEGIHLAYASDGVYLDYIPYVYDDGLYPFAYEIIYEDDTQTGFGEIRQEMVPQVIHNKADEMEIEAMCKSGLGSVYYEAGSVDQKQLMGIQQNGSIGGMWHEVNSIKGIKEMTTLQIPQIVEEYKRGKIDTINTVSGYTPVLQGLTKSGTPYASIQELGQRADIRTFGIAEKLELFQRDLVQLVVNRAAQFYTEPRKHRIEGKEGKVQYQEFSNKDILASWDRETRNGKTKEEFLPEFDITVKVIDERPTNRDYSVKLAFELHAAQLMDKKTLFETIETGELPPMQIILERLESSQQQAIQQSSQDNEAINQFAESLPDIVKEKLVKLDPDTMGKQLQEMMNMSPEQQQEYFKQFGEQP